MDFKAALAKLKGLDLEGKDELISAIEGEVSRLEGKNFEVIGEKRQSTSRVATLETAMKAIATAAGVEGDLEAILAGAEPKIRALATEATQLRTDKTALETRATEAEGKVQAAERKSKLAEIATVAGANPAVLEKLLGDKFDQLKVEGEGEARVVKLGEKPLKEAIAADEGLKLFEAALFPTTSTTDTKSTDTKAPPKLPGGSPQGKTEETKSDPAKTYMDRAYSGFKAFVPGESSK